MSTARGRKPSKVPAKSPIPAAPLAGENAGRNATLDWAIALGLMLATFAVFAQVGKFDFINYDDDLYVYMNAHVLGGLTLANIAWALTAVVVANWMPATVLSHMLDVQLFGLQSGMHHLTNVLLHALAAVLLYLTLARATRRRAASAFVAFLFALHPLHVESVAWIAERKDVLSAFFFFLALYAYVRYAERPGAGRYLLVAAAFGLGLMAKPMLVTFPFVLLLFDVWPLRRAQWPRVLWEKLPLVAMSAAASVVTYSVQRLGGAVREAIPLETRLENAVNSYLVYIVEALRPTRLAIFYAYPKESFGWQAATALLIVLGVSAAVIRVWRTRPQYAVGWFWYLGMLVPVIGLVQVGTQAHADRYTYLPLVGLGIMLAWGGVDAAQRWQGMRSAMAAAGAVCCLVWAVMATAETANWANSGTIYRHAIDVHEDSWVTEYNWGFYEMEEMKRYADALPHFRAALSLWPESAETQSNIGFCLMKTGHPKEAIPYFEGILRVKPMPANEMNLGEALANTPGRDGEAIPHLQAALQGNQDNAELNNDLAACLLNNGRAAEAIPYFEKAIRLKGDSADAHFNYALALSRVPVRVGDAITEYEAALRLRPNYAPAHHNLAQLLAQRGRTKEAIAHLEAEQKLHPDPETAKSIARLRGAGK